MFYGISVMHAYNLASNFSWTESFFPPVQIHRKRCITFIPWQIDTGKLLPSYACIQISQVTCYIQYFCFTNARNITFRISYFSFCPICCLSKIWIDRIEYIPDFSTHKHNSKSLNILIVPKFTANLYCICLSIYLLYT